MICVYIILRIVNLNMPVWFTMLKNKQGIWNSRGTTFRDKINNMAQDTDQPIHLV